MKPLMSFLSKFCSGCGACIITCPNRALSPCIYNGLVTVKIDTDACTKCNLCIKVCPVFNYMYSKCSEPTYNDIVGDILKVFIAYATSEQIRWNGASGGVITALLLYLF